MSEISNSRRPTTATPLLVAGSGGFARETLELIRALNAVTPTWQVLGVLDDDPGRHGDEVHGVPIIGACEAVHEHPEAMVVACVASPEDPNRRLRLVSRVGLSPERYATLVHPAAVVAESATLGPGCVLHAGVVLTADVELGSHVAVMPGVIFTHDDVVGDGATFGSGGRIGGAVTIGPGAYVGSGALLREQTVVGAGAVVGMGAVVTRSVPAGEVWAGVPARRCRPASAMELVS